MKPFTHPKWFHEFHPSGGVNASPLFKAFVTGNNCNNCNVAHVARSNPHTSTIVINGIRSQSVVVSAHS